MPGPAETASAELAVALATGRDAVAAFRSLRGELQELLREGSGTDLRGRLLSVSEVSPELALDTRGFVDFYAGIYHAGNVGRMFRPDQEPLLPNYRHVPIAYNGRASSLVPDGRPVRRPKGQMKTETGVEYGPTRELDFELEVGWYVGKPSTLGEPIPIEEAESHVLGIVLVNDWSARDFQRWEYQPLGPFLAKSFATSVSPWIVSLDALKELRLEGMAQEPEVLPHLRRPAGSHFDLGLGVALNGATISRSNLSNLYWSISQQLAHLTSNGANVEIGDLGATGTVSGPTPDSLGSMLELSWRGTREVLGRTFLQDGDTVTFSADGVRDGLKIGLGTLENRILPAG